MRIEILAVEPAPRIVKFSSSAGDANAAWSGSLPIVGTNVDVEIDLDFELAHGNTTVLPDDTQTRISVSPRGVSIVAIIEQIDDDRMLFMRINDNSTITVEHVVDFIPQVGAHLMIQSTVDKFRLTPFGSS